MVELFPGFMKLMAASEDWKAAIHHGVYWYVRADTNLIGPDGACVLLQAALERLAWHVLVRERRSISEEGFSKLPAADQLRLLLSALSIPLSASSGLGGTPTTSERIELGRWASSLRRNTESDRTPTKTCPTTEESAVLRCLPTCQMVS